MRSKISTLVVGLAVMTVTLASVQQPATAAESLRNRRSAAHEYAITVYTGDVTGAGTDAHVRIFIRGSLGRSSTELDKAGNDFERGQEDNYRRTMTDLGDINQICLWRDDAGLGDEWNVSHVVVGIASDPRVATAVFGGWMPAYKWICRPARYNF
jgi:hypothetical protein